MIEASLLLFNCQLAEFLQSPLRNQWISTPKFKVYVRKSVRLVNRELVKSLDLATVEVYPKFQRKGDFKKILEICRHHNPYAILYIENVLNHNLSSWLRKYKNMVEMVGEVPCFYLENKS